jgi:hypothetical protein
MAYIIFTVWYSLFPAAIYYIGICLVKLTLTILVNDEMTVNNDQERMWK